MIGQIEKQLKMDDYDLESVFTPAMVNMIIMAFVLACSIIDAGIPASKPSWWTVLLSLLGSVAATALLARFFMHFFRGTSRLFEDIHYGKDRLHFPTTSMLLLSDHSISMDTKKRVRSKLKAIYNITLLSLAKETEDIQEARRTAKEAVFTIRQAVADSGNTMVRRKLKRYGAFRNFLGGALFCFPVCVISWVVTLSKTGTNDMAILCALLVYLIIMAVDYFLARRAAVDYAETLITTFDNINHNEA